MTDCERMDALAAELALRIADGEDRAWALEHLAGCARCRAQLERMSAAADELALLAPPAEPPAGFEGRVVEGLGTAREPRARSRRLALPVAAALAGGLAAAAIVWFALGDDRDLADSYRETLAVANGRYFDATTLDDERGETIGYVYGYEGRSSWIFTVVFDGLDSGRYRLALVTDEGKRLPLRALDVSGDHGSAGAVTPVPYHEIAAIEVMDGGRAVADAELDE